MVQLLLRTNVSPFLDTLLVELMAMSRLFQVPMPMNRVLAMITALTYQARMLVMRCFTFVERWQPWVGEWLVWRPCCMRQLVPAVHHVVGLGRQMRAAPAVGRAYVVRRAGVAQDYYYLSLGSLYCVNREEQTIRLILSNFD